MVAVRTRWAAIGAAVAVTLGAGGLATVSATSPTSAVTFVPITPCRLFDTRPDFLVGDRKTPMTAGETWTVPVTGSHGNCKNIPASATAVAMNVTADLPSELTFLTVWPAGETLPNSSSLNPTPGKPSPNEVNTRLGTGGKVSIYNKLGTVHVLADITGYYVDHDHDDRYYTKEQVDARVPQSTMISIGSADFNAVGAGTIERSATGGAYPAASSTSNELVAGIELPNGASVTGFAVEFIDGDKTQDLKATLRCESMGTMTDVMSLPLAGDKNAWGVAAILSSSSTAVPAAGSSSSTINNKTCAYQIHVTAPTWPAAAQATAPLQIGAVHIEVLMPEVP